MSPILRLEAHRAVVFFLDASEDRDRACDDYKEMARSFLAAWPQAEPTLFLVQLGAVRFEAHASGLSAEACVQLGDDISALGDAGRREQSSASYDASYPFASI